MRKQRSSSPSWKLRLGTFVLLGLALSLLFISASGQEASPVIALTFEGPVTPVLTRYVERGIETAEAANAAALVLQLDTPGGSSDITQDISQLLARSRVPIVVYVAPERAHAGSAGTFITLAAHVAAMAPGSSIGAASPVSGEGQDLPDTLMKKATNILVADIKNLAERRGDKAAQWAEQAVEEAAAATAQEALELGVIDFIAPDLPSLLSQLDGFEIELLGQTRVLETASSPIRHLSLNRFEQFLNTILNPNIAFILMTLGLNAILFELSSPGGYVAGIIGAVCLFLGLYAMGLLPVNYSGLFFIGLAFVLFVLDIKAPTHGVLILAGLVSFVFGALMLFNSPYLAISIPLVIGVALATGGFFFFALTKAVAALSRRSVTGSDGLLGQMAKARTELHPTGTVFLLGELWNAITEEGNIVAGETVYVTERDGLRLTVSTQPPKD
jgi:membrane-bound serine protease (ClpP class)